MLVEAAEFDPVSIRNTARQLNLHSDSSYRFERRVDPEGLDWASRRCCELILELAGGELAAGVIDVGQPPPKREPVALRLSQLKRMLGIDVPAERVREILVALGNEEVPDSGQCQWSVVSAKPPRTNPNSESTTLDPQSQPNPSSPLPSPLVPLVPRRSSAQLAARSDARDRPDRRSGPDPRLRGHPRGRERADGPFGPAARRSGAGEGPPRADRRRLRRGADLERGRSSRRRASLSPWTDAEPLRSQMPVIRGADCLRRSLVPSLLAVRRTNEALANPEIELFEIAKVYLPRAGELPQEEIMLGITSGRDYPAVKGVIEAIVGELKVADPLESGDADIDLLDPAASCRLRLGNEMLGYVGQLTPEALAAVRSSRADHRGRDQAVAADRGGRPGAAVRRRNRPTRP